MSRFSDASGQTPSRKHDRRRQDARRRESIGLFGAPKSVSVPGWAVVERLEERTLMANAISVTGTTFTGGPAVPLVTGTPTLTSDNNLASVTIAETNVADGTSEALSIDRSGTSTLPADVTATVSSDKHTVTLSALNPALGVSDADMINAIKAVLYDDTSPNLSRSPAMPRTFTFTATDVAIPANSFSTTTTVPFSIAPPAINLTGVTAGTFNGTAGAQVFGGTPSFSSVNNLSQVVVTIANIQDAGKEVLYAPTSTLPADVTATSDSAGTVSANTQATGASTIYLTATTSAGVSLADMKQALQAILYYDGSTSLTETPARTFTVTVTDAGVPTTSSSPVTTTGLINFSIPAPSFTLFGVGSTPIPYPGQAVAVLPSTGTGNNAVVLNSRNNIGSATVTLAAPPDGSSEAFTLLSGFPSGFTTSTSTVNMNLVLTITPTAAGGVTGAAMLTALEHVGYIDSAATVNTATNRSITIQVNDTGSPSQSGMAATTIDFESNLVVVASQPSPAMPVAQQNTTFHFTIQNTGTSPAYQLVVQDQFALKNSANNPATVNFLSVLETDSNDTIASSSYANNALTINFKYPLAPGDTTGVDVHVSPSVDGSGFMSTVTPTVATGELNDNTTKSFSTTPVNVAPVADLAITAGPATMLNGDTSFRAGHQVQFQVTVTNNGISAANGLSLSNLIGLVSGDPNASATASSNVQIISATEVGATDPLSPANPGTADPLVLTFANPLAPSASVTVDIVVDPLFDGQLNNVVTASLSNSETNSGDTTKTSATVTVLPVTTLNISETKLSPPDPVLIGQSPEYQIEVQNTGPSAAYDLSLADVFGLPLSSNFSVTEADGKNYQVTGSVSSKTLTLVFGQPVPAGQTAIIDVTVTPVMSGSLTSTVTATVGNNEELVGSASGTLATPTTIHDFGTASLGAFSPSSLQRMLAGQPTQTATLTLSRTPAYPGDPLDATSVVLNYADLDNQLTAGTDYTVFEIVNGVRTMISSGATINFAAGTTGSGVDQVQIELDLFGSNSIKTQNSDIQFSLTAAATTPAAAIGSPSMQDLPITNSQQFVVRDNSDNPSDSVSLRGVLAAANAFSMTNSSPVVITFAIQGTGTDGEPTAANLTIALNSTLEIAEDVTIDGSSEPFLTAGVHVIIDQGTSFSGDGLLFDKNSAGSTLQNVEVKGFTGNGIEIQTDNVTIRSSTITGSTAGVVDGFALNGDGIRIEASNDTVGDADALLGNIISNNAGYGIEVIGLVSTTIAATTTPSTTTSGLVAGTAVNLSGITIENNSIGNATVTGVATPFSGNSLGGVIVEDSIKLTSTMSATTGSGTVTTTGTTTSGTVASSIAGGAVLIRSNGIGSNANFDVELDGSTGTSIRTNTIGGSSGVGISLTGKTSNAVLLGNGITITGGTGISLTGTITSTTLDSNTITGSAGATAGIVLSSVSGVTPNPSSTPNVTITGDSVKFTSPSTGILTTGISLTGVSLTGANAVVSIVSDTITGTNVSGISVATSTGDSIVGASITATTGNGITSTGDNGISIVGSTIKGTTTAGISLSGVISSPDSITGNSISGTVGTGIIISGMLPANPMNIMAANVITAVTSNTIGATATGDTLGIGISLFDAGTSSISGDTILGSSTVGITVTNSGTTSNTTIANTGVTTSANDGIEVTDGNVISISQTTVKTSGTLGTGISISSATDLDIDTTSVTNSSLTGIALSSVSGASITNSMITGSTTTGQTGISVNASSGVSIGTNTDTGNTVNGTTIAGISIVNSMMTSVIGTTVTPSGGDAIDISGGSSNTTVLASDLNGTKTTDGINVFGVTSATKIEQNGIFGSLDNAIEVTGSPTAVTIEQNTIDGASPGNIALAPGNHGDGIYVHDLVVPAPSEKIEGNEIINSLGNGIEIVNADGVSLVGNTIGTDLAKTSTSSGNVGDGVSLTNSAGALVAYNAIYESGLDKAATPGTLLGDGLLLENAKDAMVEGNDIEDNALNGIDSYANVAATTLSIQGNTVQGNLLDGVRVDGGSRTPGTVGLSLVVTGNMLTSNAVVGLEVTGAPGLIVTGNYIGTDFTGKTGLGNKQGGFALAKSSNSTITDNTIAGNDQGLGALTGTGLTGINFSGAGLDVESSSNVTISGNLVGLGPDGITQIGNGVGGIKITDPNGSMITGNAISGNFNYVASGTLKGDPNGFGLDLTVSPSGTNTADVLVAYNQVGTNATGTAARGNLGTGIEVGDVPNLFIEGNVISANTGVGLEASGTPDIQVVNNTVGGGTTNGRTIALGNGLGGLYLTGTLDASVMDNTIVGNQVAGLMIDGGSSDLPSSTTVSLNTIGTDSTHAASLGNQGDGILIDSTVGVSITSNLIDSNTMDGIKDSASGLSVLNNIIGTDANGDANLGNDLAGIAVASDSATPTVTYVTIGSNQIGGNGTQGVSVSGTSGLMITGNAIGFAEIQGDPVVPAGNQGDGILIAASTSTGVSGNFIGFSGKNGVEIDAGSSGIMLTSNQVGRFPGSGSSSANAGDGVLIEGVSGNSTVTLNSNILSQNGKDGLELDDAQGVIFGDTNNTISGNVTNGVEVDTGSMSNAFDGGMVTGNKGDGFHFESSSNATLTGVTIASNGGDGVHVTGSTGVTISGATIQLNSQAGILFDMSSSGNVVSGGTIGGALLGNLSDGVEILSASSSDVLTNNSISGVTIEANDGSGILIQGFGANGNTLKSNTIGGGLGLGNGNGGVSIASAGKTNMVLSNTISGNTNFGVAIDDTSSTSVTGGTISNNSSNGVSISDSSTFNTISGATIANNLSNGVVISNLSTNNLISGSTVEGSSLAGVLVLDSSYNTVGFGGSIGTALSAANTIVSNLTDGVDLFGGSPNSITGVVGSSNTVAGNFIGTDAYNTMGLGNKGDGVHIVGSPSNTIGGLIDQDVNVISANKQSGVEVFGSASMSNAILGNVIGTRSSNTNLDNQLNGVVIAGAQAIPAQNVAASNPQNNYIGSMPDGQVRGNIIAGNQADGIAIVAADNNFILGNSVGLFSGVTGQGNFLDGVSLQYSTGTTVEAGNSLSGNVLDGIDVLSSTGSMIAGNLIQGNVADGVRLEQGSSGNTIGMPGAGNVIVGNLFGAGVEVRTASTNNTIQSNLIGLDFSGTSDTNALGVYLNQVDSNIVGGTTVGSANTVTDNILDGIYVSGNSGATVISPVLGTVLQGNTIEGNFVGTSATGGTPISVAPNVMGTDVGIDIINSAGNAILGNVASGNHSAGIELFGQASTNNILLDNTVGSDLLRTKPILLDGQQLNNVYHIAEGDIQANRQEYGIYLDGAPDNLIGTQGLDNYVLGNEFGIDVAGATATGNAIAYNVVGPVADLNPNDSSSVNYPLQSTGQTTAAGYASLFSGLGNFFGIYIDAASQTKITDNTVDDNISVGLTLAGAAATYNVVQANHIDDTGGYSTDFSPLDPDGNASLVTFADAKKDQAYIFGTGIFLVGAVNNVIGSDPTSNPLTNPKLIAENPSQGNTLIGNKQVGIYVFDDGTAIFTTGTTPTNSNYIRSNLAVGINYEPGNTGTFNQPFNGDYGILLYNSSADLIDPLNPIGPGVQLNLTYQDHFATSTMTTPVYANRIANFREYTGAVDPLGPNTLGSNGLTSSLDQMPITAASQSVAIKALSTTSKKLTVNVNADGKGHPLPPVMKSVRRKN